MARVIDDVLYLTQGDTEEISIAMKDGSGTTVAFSVGDVVTLTVRETPLAETATISISETVTSATAGNTFNLHIPAATMALATIGEYSGDIQVVFAGTSAVKTIWPVYDSEKKWVKDTNWKNVKVVAEVTR